MKSICLFASYFTSHDLPYYVKVYLKELKTQFQEVLLLCSQEELSEASLDFLKKEGIGLSIELNEGFDFGLWVKAFQKFNITSYEQVILVNDSCVLFKPLAEFVKWSKSNDADFQGMTYSEAIAPHLQSYFLVINKPAIKYVDEYFRQNGLFKTIAEVIQIYEVGLSTHLLSKGMRMAAYVDNNGYAGEFSPYYHCVDYHIKKGIPLIKRKILFSSYRKDELFTLARMNFKIDASHYTQLIKQINNDLLLDFEKLEPGKTGKLSFFSKMNYQATRIGISFLRKLLHPKSTR